MSMRTLKKFIRDNGKAATAVALGLKETNAINNWIARNEIPKAHKENVRKLPVTTVTVSFVDGLKPHEVSMAF